MVAVADDRSNSLVVSAPADLLSTIETMVKEIDQEVTDVTELRVFRLVNADPTETADQLAMLFPDPTTSTTSGSQKLHVTLLLSEQLQRPEPRQFHRRREWQ